MRPIVHDGRSLKFSGTAVVLAGTVSFLLGVLITSRLLPPPVGIISVAGSNPVAPSARNADKNIHALRQSFHRSTSTGETAPPFPRAKDSKESTEPSKRDERSVGLLQKGKLAFQDKIAAQRRTNYSPVLVALGLQPEQVESVLESLADLHQGAMTAGDATLDLLNARLKYTEDLKKLLGDERFAQYEAFERGKPYRQEVANIRDFAGRDWPMLEPKDETALVRLLEAHAMSTTESWDGPYDPAPRPQAGRPAVLAINTEYLSRLSSGLLPFLEDAQTQLPESLSTITRSYYQSRVAELQEERRVLSMTEEDHRRYVEERVRRIRKAQPGQ